MRYTRTKMSVERNIFIKGSRTYFWSSVFFPRQIRDDVFRLYSFVRVADDYVDEEPKQPQKLLSLEKRWQQAQKQTNFNTRPKQDDTIDERIIINLMYLCKKHDFKPQWIQAFFTSMKQDIKPRPYVMLDDSLEYVYGSAEVVGLMMTRIMDLPQKAQRAARYQGRAMQWVNFIRDIQEDNDLGRLYFPKEDLKKFQLRDMKESTARANSKQFKAFMHFQIKRYQAWQTEADKGMKYIPRRLRIPLKTAVSMYNWTARRIERDPMVVFQTKVKPSKSRVITAAVWSSVRG